MVYSTREEYLTSEGHEIEESEFQINRMADDYHSMYKQALVDGRWTTLRRYYPNTSTHTTGSSGC
jgi:hypothetical protein